MCFFFSARVQGLNFSGGSNSTCNLLLALRVMGRFGPSFGRGSDGARDSQAAEFGTASSAMEVGIWSWISCGDKDEDPEDPERIR